VSVGVTATFAIPH